MFRDLVSVKWRKLSELGWDLMIIDTRHLPYITSHFLFCITNCMFNNFSKLVLRELAFGYFSIIGLQKYIQPLTYLSDRRVNNYFERFNYGIFFLDKATNAASLQWNGSRGETIFLSEPKDRARLPPCRNLITALSVIYSGLILKHTPPSVF